MKRWMAFAAAVILMTAMAFGSTERIPLVQGWKFVKADDPKIGTNYGFKAMGDVLDRANRGDLTGAPANDWSKPGFDDGTWKTVQVPHDWGIESTYDPSRRYGDAFLDVVGVGWYRTKFKVQGPKLNVGERESCIPKGGKVFFECDGAMSYAHVWINGTFVGGWPYGYTRFRLDLTPYLNYGGRNVLAVRCHNVIDSSRWYTGGGLFRGCRLLVCPKDHVVPGSVHITTPEITAKSAKVRVRYEMSESGRREFAFDVGNPHLWDIDDPYLYEVDIEGDRYRYGIRTIAFHADERRFQLNGRTVPLNGVSMHHDFGVLGGAWNRTAQKRRLRLFREAGVNAIRSSHNPPDEGLLELCDELGLLVKDEVFDEWRYTGRVNGNTGDAGKRVNGYTNLFDTWHERDIRAWIRTDRNHPSVIMYSLGNEIPDGKHYIAPTSEYIARSRELARIAASEDDTRPTTAANNNSANFTNDYPMALALMGCNYSSWQYPELKRRYPAVPFFGTETVCMSSTRGEYVFPVTQTWPKADEWTELVNSSYCWQASGFSRADTGWACPPDVQWYWMDRVGTCMGEFIWTGVDYLGGPSWCDELRTRLKRPGDGIHTCNTGFLDQAGFRKDAFWLFQSRWRPDFPMAHILPHWNWAGREGQATPVYVFTSGDEGELFLNGRSLGRRKKQPGVWDRAYRLRWDDVRYTPGKLEVVVYKDGKEWARDTVVTTGPVAQLGIEAENDEIVSDGEDIAYVNVCVKDGDGNVVPRTQNLVKFTVEGPGFVLATDNGYEADMSDFHAGEHRVFNGWVQALVRARPGATGTLTVTAAADGLRPVKAKVFVNIGLTASALPERRVNTDESKVPPYAIEDVLVSTSGVRLTSAAQWPGRRREMLALVERELYGKWPKAPETLVIDEQEEHRTFYDLARIRQFTMRFREDRSGPRIDWMLLEPMHAKEPVPVIVMLNYRGNHEHMAEPCVGVSDFWVDGLRQRGAIPHRVDASVRGQMRYPYDLVLARGYAVLTACYHQAAPDPLPEDMPLEEIRSRGLYQLWEDRDVGTLSVWGWALCRGLDLASRQPGLDAKRAVAYGYSRLGKAALVAGAFDERFAVVVACQPGGGGVALQKRQFGENADWMTQVFPHWFCSAYRKYANNEASMPLDQHFLVAAVAPRRLLVQGFDEPWYDTKGEWLSCQAASPAWELLGRKGLSAGEFPDDFSTAATAGDIGYVRRPGSHGISGYDWMWMLDFADASWRVIP